VAKTHSQTYSIDLTRVSVPAEDGSQQQLSLMSIIDQYRSTPLMPILSINKKMRHKQQINTHNLNSSTKIHQQQNKLHKQQNNLKQSKNPLHYLLP
jgi:hypothetical protein